MKIASRNPNSLMRFIDESCNESKTNDNKNDVSIDGHLIKRLNHDVRGGESLNMFNTFRSKHISTRAGLALSNVASFCSEG